MERGPVSSRDGSQEHRDTPKERPVLNLKPRTKPVENKENQPASRSSIFGAAKPVDTYAREKEIEEKLKKKDVDDHSLGVRRDSDSDRGRRRSGDRYSSGGDSRRQSGDRSVPISRRDSEHSYTSDDGGHKEEALRSPTSVKSTDSAPKLVPAPPPKENPWTKKKEGGSLSSSSNTSNVSNNASVASQDRKDATPLKNLDTCQTDTPDHSDSGSETDDIREEKVELNENKPNAWGRGRPGAPKSEGRKPPVVDKANGSQNGPPARRSENIKSRPKDKPLPKSIEEMPKYEETKTKDFSDRNKFSYLDEDEGRDSEGDAGELES